MSWFEQIKGETQRREMATRDTIQVMTVDQARAAQRLEDYRMKLSRHRAEIKK